TNPCSYLVLQHDFGYTYGKPPVLANYTSPSNCPSQKFSKIVLEWNATCKGRQFDRIFGVWLSGVEIFRSCTAGSQANGIVWTVKKDITRVQSLFTVIYTGGVNSCGDPSVESARIDGSFLTNASRSITLIGWVKSSYGNISTKSAQGRYSNYMGYMLVKGRLVVSGLGSSQQVYKYKDDSCFYSRNISSSNYTILHDKVSDSCPRSILSRWPFSFGKLWSVPARRVFLASHLVILKLVPDIAPFHMFHSTTAVAL
ncbi:hypothetical protein HAX54_044410, partial [Datura stramonium]|nr:hypothetical protein [Datura stramonium]